jgi:hypothetical protein
MDFASAAAPAANHATYTYTTPTPLVATGLLAYLIISATGEHQTHSSNHFKLHIFNLHIIFLN